MNPGALIRGIQALIKYGNYKDVPSFLEAYGKMQQQLEDAKEKLVKSIENIAACNHAWNDPTYSVRKGVIGSHYYYQRICKTCGFTQSQTAALESSCPDWAKDAKHKQI